MDRHRIHLYTVLQLIFFAMLYSVKTIKAIAIAFPFFILLCIPARLYLLPCIFYEYELIVLDGSPEAVEAFVMENIVVEGEDDDSDGAQGKPLIVEGTEKNEDEDEDSGEAAREAQDEVPPLPNRPVTEDNENREGNIPAFVGHDHTPEMVNNARRRAGRVDHQHRVRKKTVSDLSGMFQAPSHETVWSHV